MKLANLPIEATFGADKDPDWKKQSTVPTAHEEESDTEDADDDDKDAVSATLGFDASELFKES